MNDELIDLLARLHEYMNDRADFKDQNIERGEPIPNIEACFAYEIDNILEKLK